MNERPPESSRRTAHAWVAAAVPGEVYDEIASALTNPDSPVGIDARHTHVLILHALDRIERRLDGAVPASAAPALTTGASGIAVDGVALATRARELLERSRVAESLDPALRRRVEAAIARTVARVAADSGAAFPGFVAGLLDGVFEAIVNASIRQMEAYAELLEGVAEGADAFGGEAGSRKLATQRQRLLATMVLMGVNRIEVTRGRVRVRSIFDDDDDD